LPGERSLEDEIRPPAEVDGDLDVRLVHRQQEAVAADAPLVAERTLQRLAERERDVLDGVVLVDLEVAAALHAEREAAMLAELLQHVVEEPDAGTRDGLRLAIEIDLDADVRLARLALDDRRARPVEQHVDHVRPRLLARTVLRDHEAGDADVLRELEILGAAADDRGALTVEDAGREELAHESDAR